MRSLRLFGHPIHPITVHVPLGLLLASPLWDVLGLALGDPTWWAVSFWTIALGCAASVPSIATGFLELAALPRGDPAGPAVERHLYFAVGAIAAFGSSLLFRSPHAAPVGSDRVLALVLAWSGWALLAAAGYLGGELVYARGLGRAAGGSERRGLVES